MAEVKANRLKPHSLQLGPARMTLRGGRRSKALGLVAGRLGRRQPPPDGKGRASVAKRNAPVAISNLFSRNAGAAKRDLAAIF